MIKQLLDELPEDTMLSVNDTNEKGFYPGEEQAEIETSARMWELSKYSDQELREELDRRLFEPLNQSLRDLKVMVDKFNGYTPDKPF